MNKLFLILCTFLLQQLSCTVEMRANDNVDPWTKYVDKPFTIVGRYDSRGKIGAYIISNESDKPVYIVGTGSKRNTKLTDGTVVSATGELKYSKEFWDGNNAHASSPAYYYFNEDKIVLAVVSQKTSKQRPNSKSKTVFLKVDHNVAIRVTTSFGRLHTIQHKEVFRKERVPGDHTETFAIGASNRNPFAVTLSCKALVQVTGLDGKPTEKEEVFKLNLYPNGTSWQEPSEPERFLRMLDICVEDNATKSAAPKPKGD